MSKLTEKQIQKILKENSMEPDALWVKQTRQNLSTIAENSVTTPTHRRTSTYTLFNLLSLRFMQSVFKKPVFLALTATVLVVGGVTGALVFSRNRQTTTQDNKVYLTEEQKREFLTNVIKNNPKQALAKANVENQNATLTVNTEENADTAYGLGGAGRDMAIQEPAPADISILPYPYQPDYAYRHSKTTTTFGGAYEDCKVLSWFDTFLTTGTVYESFDYFDQSGQSYNKSISKTPEGQVFNYYLNKYNNNGSESYTYFGGQYAVKTTYIYPTVLDPVASVVGTDPSATPEMQADADNQTSNVTDPDTIIDSYFGPDADIVEKVTKDGKDLYIVEYRYPMDCDAEFAPYLSSRVGGAAESSADDTVIYRDLIDINTFESYESQIFLNSVAESNLITRTQNTFETSDVPFSQVAGDFEFEYDVQVKEETFDMTNLPQYDPAAEAAKVADYLATQNIDLPYVVGGTLNYAYAMKAFEEINIVNQSLNYYTDRAFYPAGTLGDTMFDAYNKASEYIMPIDYITEEVNMSFTMPDGIYYSVSVFAKGTNTIQDVKNQFVFPSDEYSTSTESTISVTINGTPVAATVVETTYNYDTAVMDAPAKDVNQDIAIEGGIPSSYTQRTLFVENGNFVYVMWLDVNSNISSLAFTTKNTQTDAASIRQDIQNAYTTMLDIKPMPVEGDGGIGGGTEPGVR